MGEGGAARGDTETVTPRRVRESAPVGALPRTLRITKDVPMAKENSYFMYFPGNYRWSAAFINMMGSAAYGGSEIAELHRIGQLLQGKSGEDDDAWFDACVKVA